MSDARPDPAELLARARREHERSGGPGAGAGRGRLKIFFGMAPGVGKTFAMLAAAQRMAAQGVDVVVGVVETHGRAETEQLLLGLDILPRKKVEYGAVALTEFDAEAAIARRPDILLVDELAHTNAPGSPREKRWQDVRECLNSGVNVCTTLNVQHLESLNDVVAQITGVAVRETVPDSVFDEADEVELVDLPPEALHERLKAGKVYLAESAARAVDPSDGFFRRGNLTALRELALRRTAAWVDSELRRYRQDRGIRAVWPAGERIMVAVSPSPMSARLIRAAKRMAAGLNADLIAVYAQTAASAPKTDADRERVAQHMRLAESLGATTATIGGESAARELVAFARSRNVSRIVVGKTGRARWRERLFGSFIDDLIRESGDVDVYVVRGDDAALPERGGPAEHREPGARRGGSSGGPAQYAAAAALVGAVTLLGMAALANLDLANIAMVYLAAVVVCALWLGRGPSIFASVAGVAVFDFCFVPPRWSFAVSDVQYAVTFGVMLAVGLVIGTLAARTREQAREAWERERLTGALYALSRALAAARDAREVAAIAARHAHDLSRADAVVCVPASCEGGGSGLDVLASSGAPDWFDERERAVAQWAIDHGKPAGIGASRLPSAAGRYVPLVGASGRVGVLGVRPARGVGEAGGGGFTADDMLRLEAVASQAGSALERAGLSESRQSARLDAERERLRSALLSSVSHDLRTPLAGITGAASALEEAEARPGGPADEGRATRTALLGTIVAESGRLNDIIANLVFATRLESGAVELRREWTTLEEVVGVGLSRHREALSSRPFRVYLPADLPMIRVDNALMPQVVHNLIENSLRYTPPGTPIAINAWASHDQVIVKVSDEGPGLAEDEASRVFQRFYRGRASRAAAAREPGAGSDAPAAASPGPGMGLGLTICEGVVRAHGGRIWAEPNSPRGVAFFFSLPVEHPQPSMPADFGAAAEARA